MKLSHQKNKWKSGDGRHVQIHVAMTTPWHLSVMIFHLYVASHHPPPDLPHPPPIPKTDQQSIPPHGHVMSACVPPDLSCPLLPAVFSFKKKLFFFNWHAFESLPTLRRIAAEWESPAFNNMDGMGPPLDHCKWEFPFSIEDILTARCIDLPLKTAFQFGLSYLEKFVWLSRHLFHFPETEERLFDFFLICRLFIYFFCEGGWFTEKLTYSLVCAFFWVFFFFGW